jgi:peptidoglycan/LPS O-acetylase OafA/YrhL
VTGVFLFHESAPGAQLGWAGVELFYVISGFLITGGLLRSRGGPNFLRTFYLRRGLRILPIYWLALLLGVVISTARLGAAAVGFVPVYFLYVQNYYPQASSGFTEGLRVLDHTWTLAIEEQFYWLWPLAILVFSGKRLVGLVVMLFVSAPLIRMLLLSLTGNPVAVTATLPSQADGLAAGAALAILIDRGASPVVLRRVGLVAFVLGAASTGALVVRSGLDAFTPPTLWAADPVNAFLLSSLALLFAGLVTMTVTSTGPLVRVLSLPPLRWSGRISYGLYLYAPFAIVAVHTVARILGLDETRGSPVLIAGTHLVVGYVFAVVSWRYLEAPLARLKGRVAPEVPSLSLDIRVHDPLAVRVPVLDSRRILG